MRKNKKISPRDCIVKGTNKSTGEVQYFLNVASVVKAVGCTRAHAYNVLNKVGYFKTAKGWQLEWVDFDDIAIRQKKSKKSKKTDVEVQMHEDGDQVSEAEHWQLVENILK